MTHSVFNYLNYRDFLRDYYLGQKGKNVSFSYQKLAWKAGFRSKSFFKDVIEGKKNISAASIFSVGKAVELEGEPFSYFQALVAFNQAKTGAEKADAFRRLAPFQKRSQTQRVAQHQFDFYSRWYHNTVREWVTLMDFKEDYVRLGRSIKPSISAAEAKASVKLLLRLGLIVLKNGRYLQTHTAITTGEEVKGVAVNQFQIQNLKLAAASLDICRGDERDISTLIAGLSPEGFKTVKAEIQSFRKKLVEIIGQDATATRVYHINFQFFPTSEKEHDI